MNDLADRIDNWAHWNRANREPYGRCASIESRYVAPRPDEDESARHAREPIDYVDAEFIERAVQRIHYPLVRTCLRLWYVRRSPIKKLCRELGLRAHLLETFHQRCLIDLGQSIRLLEHQESLHCAQYSYHKSGR